MNSLSTLRLLTFDYENYRKELAIELCGSFHNLIIETAKLIMIKKRNGDNILELLQYQNSLIYKLYDLSYSDVIEVEPDFYMNKDDYKSVVL